MPETQKLTKIRVKFTWVSQELKSPNVFKNVENIEDSTASEFPKVSASHIIWGETAVLPKNEGDQSNVEKNEDWNVDKWMWILVQKFDCVLQHVSLELDLVRIEA